MSIKTTLETQLNTAADAKQRRKWLKYSREKAAELSGVPASTIRKFENTGDISFRQLLMLLKAYGNLEALEAAFSNPPAQTMDELIKIARKESL